MHIYDGDTWWEEPDHTRLWQDHYGVTVVSADQVSITCDLEYPRPSGATPGHWTFSHWFRVDRAAARHREDVEPCLMAYYLEADHRVIRQMMKSEVPLDVILAGGQSLVAEWAQSSTDMRERLLLPLRMEPSHEHDVALAKAIKICAPVVYGILQG